uniref:Uncharacterized protein n=1 Tax=Glossina austeni TaxID=7395 RepID=A0A1A9VC58_GLOAU
MLSNEHICICTHTKWQSVNYSHQIKLPLVAAVAAVAAAVAAVAAAAAAVGTELGLLLAVMLPSSHLFVANEQFLFNTSAKVFTQTFQNHFLRKYYEFRYKIPIALEHHSNHLLIDSKRPFSSLVQMHNEFPCIESTIKFSTLDGFQ